MRKWLGAALLGVVAGGLGLAGGIEAADLQLSCADDKCRFSDEEPLFKVNDMAPGDSVKRELTIENQRDEKCDFKILIQESNVEPDDFGGRLFTAISAPVEDVYGKTLDDVAGKDKKISDLLGEDEINLGQIEPGGYLDLKWLVTFDRETGNDYQGARLSFDLDINATCTEAEVLGVSDASVSAKATRNTASQVAGLWTRFPVAGLGVFQAGAVVTLGAAFLSGLVWAGRQRWKKQG